MKERNLKRARRGERRITGLSQGPVEILLRGDGLVAQRLEQTHLSIESAAGNGVEGDIVIYLVVA